MVMNGGRVLQENITGLLHSWRGGDEGAKNALFDSVYATLREMAQSRLGAKSVDVTLRPTSLVHEAMVRMLGRDIDFADRAHFFALAALKMRAVLVDHARSSMAAKRGGGVSGLTLSSVDQGHAADEDADSYEVLALHQALCQLAELDIRSARVVELAYFGGMVREEIALVLGVSVPTVDRDLRFAKAWLNRKLA